MKTLLFFFLFTLTAQAQTFKPVRGLYVCKIGNENSICDQILRPSFDGDQLSSISVEYVGWCGSMGPYIYYCEDGVCENEGLKFVFKDETHYFWENKQYGYHCEFEKK
jgi:hypothetical protein